ncbi:MAG: YbaK/EbsC family protein [Vicinamibacterales bacterium]
MRRRTPLRKKRRSRTSSGRDWAKPVVFFADGEPIMAVVPADLVIDLEQLLLLTGAERIRLATEEELAALYPDCEPGAMPPLGPLYNQPVFIDIALAAQPQIVFNGGTHGDAVCMRYDDFAALARPVVGSFAMRPGHSDVGRARRGRATARPVSRVVHDRRTGAGRRDSPCP